MSDLTTSAHELLDSINYLTLATIDEDGTPRASPLYFTPHQFTDFYWVSNPNAQHSLNIAREPRTMAVVFDSQVRVGEADAVYLTGEARMVPDNELADRCRVAFSGRGGASVMTPKELGGETPLRLYLLQVHTAEVLIRAGHPTLGSGSDRRVEISLR